MLNYWKKQKILLWKLFKITLYCKYIWDFDLLRHKEMFIFQDKVEVTHIYSVQALSNIKMAGTLESQWLTQPTTAQVR